MGPTTRHQIRALVTIEAPAADVWARISDHESTPTWVDEVKRVTISRPGEPRNGFGAIRVVEFRPRLWSTIHEEVTVFSPDVAFEYVLFKGMPALASHVGRLSIDVVNPSTSVLHWDVDFEFRVLHPFRLFLGQFLRDFEGVINRALVELKRQLESRD